MRRFILTIAALTLASPAIAASQLESLLRVSPGVYSSAELAELHFSRGNKDAPPVFFDMKGTIVFSSHGDRPEAARSVETPVGFKGSERQNN